jgi:hypothetical protein
MLGRDDVPQPPIEECRRVDAVKGAIRRLDHALFGEQENDAWSILGQGAPSLLGDAQRCFHHRLRGHASLQHRALRFELELLFAELFDHRLEASNASRQATGIRYERAGGRRFQHGGHAV